ncbi:hypothetical protein E2P81_ATG02773 [Venturia nashicola]|nr:hypothetical protein E2P81_ATG02773 [Venturia nashicola]
MFWLGLVPFVEARTAEKESFVLVLRQPQGMPDHQVIVTDSEVLVVSRRWVLASPFGLKAWASPFELKAWASPFELKAWASPFELKAWASPFELKAWASPFGLKA